MAFGSIHSVMAWSATAVFVVHMMNFVFLIVALVYIDDIMSAQPAELADDVLDCMKLLIHGTGLRLSDGTDYKVFSQKEPVDKTVNKVETDILGVEMSFVNPKKPELFMSHV